MFRRDKAGMAAGLVLNAEALDAVRTMKRERSVLSPFVFCTPEGKSLNNNFNRYWTSARTAAQLLDFRFHDLRHTFASRLVRQGLSSYVVQHAGGWRTASMMARYAHLDPHTIRAAVKSLTVRSSATQDDPNGHQIGHQRPEGPSSTDLSTAATP